MAKVEDEENRISLEKQAIEEDLKKRRDIFFTEIDAFLLSIESLKDYRYKK